MPVPRTTTWIAVADGGKALLLENKGSRMEPDLTVLKKEIHENPPNREHVTDRPGRFRDDGQGQRSGYGEPFWHEFEEARFAQEFAEILNDAAAADRFDELILVAPDRALGRLRPALSPATAGRVTSEIHKDLTNHPVEDMEKVIEKELFPLR